MTTENRITSSEDSFGVEEWLLPKLDRSKIIRAASVATRETKVGRVVSAKNAKTLVVSVTKDSAHPKYKRVVRKQKKFYAHDEHEIAREGDIVKIVCCRPMSKMKRWSLVEVVARGMRPRQV